MKLNDLTNKVFGSITVLKRVPNIGKNTMWLCQCICGKIWEVAANNLTHQTKSCGCVNFAKRTSHGHTKEYSKSLEYNTWSQMINRCYNNKSKNYEFYGKLGIKVCDRWRNSFENFLEDMGERPDKLYTIDRIDSKKDYFLENCRWANKKQQSNNRKNNLFVLYNNKQVTLKEASELSGISYNALLYRYKCNKFLGENINYKQNEY